jgi:hypothetical protein
MATPIPKFNEKGVRKGYENTGMVSMLFLVVSWLAKTKPGKIKKHNNMKTDKINLILDQKVNKKLMCMLSEAYTLIQR